MDLNEQVITFDDNGVISGLNPEPAVETDGPEWDSPEATNPPAADSTSTSPEAGEDDAEGETQAGDDAALTSDEDEWSDTKPAAKADPDDVPPEDRDPKGKVPSWRVREIREKADKEIARLQAENEALKAGKPAAKAETQAPPADEHAALLKEIHETDPVVKDCTSKLDYIQDLLEKGDSEKLKSHFTSQEHLNATISQLVAQREARIAAVQGQREQTKTQTQQRQVEQREQYLNKLATNYETAIKTSKIPDCTKYAQRIASNAGKLHIGVRELILHAEEPDVLTAAIGSNRKLFDELAAHDPTKPLTHVQLAAIGLKLGKAVAKYQAPKQSVVDEPVQRAPSAPQPTTTRRSSHPTHVPRYRVDRDGTIVM